MSVEDLGGGDRDRTDSARTDLSGFPHQEAPPILERELTIAKLSLFARRAPINAGATMANAVLLCVLLYPSAPPLELGLWLALQLGGAGWFIHRTRRPRRPPRGSERGLRRAAAFSTLAGSSLGTVVWLVEGSSPVAHLLVFVTLAAMASAASTTLASVPRAAHGYIAGALLLPAAFWLSHGEREYVVIALLSVSMTGFLVFNARITHESFLEGLRHARQLETLRARFQAELSEWLDLSQGTEAFALLDPSGSLLLWNQRFEELLEPSIPRRGQAYSELLAASASVPVSVNGSAVTKDDWIGLRKKLNGEETELLEGHEGGVFHRVSMRHLPSGRYALLIMDVSALKRAEQALHEREVALLRAQRQESVGVIAGGVAHDFNNLLMGIGGAAELLAELADAPEAQNLLADIRASVERGSRLTRQLLAYGRKQQHKPRAIDLNEVLARQLPLFRRLLPATIDLETALDAQLWKVSADPEQLEQVAMNLVLNARDAMPRGGQLRLITRNAAADRVEFRVEDTGIGMSEETAKRAFEPFFSTKQNHQGSGLGLSAVHGIVRQNGGLVSLESRVNVGTRVTIQLPRSEAASEPATTSRPHSTIESLRASLAQRILVVDDEELVLGTTAGLLQRLGYDVLAATRAADALELLAHDAGGIALLVTDVVMPDMNGAELAAAARIYVPSLPVLFISGYDPGVLAPFDAPNVLQKPFSREQLQRAVEKALAPAQSASAQPVPKGA